MIIKVKAPSPGESVSEIEISSWLVKDGDFVSKGQILAEIDSDKATLEIPSEENGKIKLLKKVGEKIKVKDTICLIDTSLSSKNEKKNEVNLKEINKKNNIKIISPASKKILRENNISINMIHGTGKKGIITKKDCLTFQEKEKTIISNIKSYRPKTITPLSPLRKKLSRRLVSIRNKAAILTTFNEVDMSNVISIRNKYKEEFKNKHKVNLGFMSFFTISCIKALKKYPDVNACIQENKKINFEYYDISIAMSGPKGLMVPVIRNAENLSFKGIEQEISRLFKKVKIGNISIDEMNGGTFTITNGGVFGSMLSTPIINPPQSAILGMHKILERPIVINKSIHIRPIMYLALSYDHRIIDGKESVGFLYFVKECIEKPIKYLMDNNKENIPKVLELF